MSSAFIGGMVAGVILSTGVKVPQYVHKGDSITDPDTLYARLALPAHRLYASQPALGSTTTTNTTLTNTGVAWTVDEWIGDVVTCNGKTMTVTANTATELTGSSWSGGGNPGNGYAFTIAATAFKLKIRRNGTAIQKSGDAEIEIVTGENAGEVTGLDSFTVADGDYFDVDVTEVGSVPTQGADLVWEVAR